MSATPNGRARTDTDGAGRELRLVQVCARLAELGVEIAPDTLGKRLRQRRRLAPVAYRLVRRPIPVRRTVLVIPEDAVAALAEYLRACPVREPGRVRGKDERKRDARPKQA
jgi:hypothetical protein